jgi:hypothetical protein
MQTVINYHLDTGHTKGWGGDIARQTGANRIQVHCRFPYNHSYG